MVRAFPNRTPGMQNTYAVGAEGCFVNTLHRHSDNPGSRPALWRRPYSKGLGPAGILDSDYVDNPVVAS